MERKINYRAQIKLVPVTNDPKNRFHLLKMISNWINATVSNEKYKKVIYHGIQKGHLDLDFGDTHLKIRTVTGNNDEDDVPKYYAIRFSHGESGSGPMAGWRTWINDITLEKVDNDSYLFSMSNSYQIGSGYIGRIDEPLITSPNIIKQIVGNSYWTSFIGNTALPLEPIEITHYNVKQLIASIFDANRSVPLVYISRDDSGHLLIDPSELSMKVVGNSIVYHEGTSKYY